MFSFVFHAHVQVFGGFDCCTWQSISGKIDDWDRWPNE